MLSLCCVSCGHVAVNQGSPICALEGKGSTDPDTSDAKFPSEELPSCEKRACHALLRLNMTWYGETLDLHILTKVETVLDTCDLCLVHLWNLCSICIL
uniref:NAD-dependent protein deacylase sirtuin-5, mitochondrial-like n=1 Tax=Oncorhynchus gorbuscha TaxID=8017 RepID=UPI001EAF1191|nr:NAD-dependent protein deacylase sirtuin-5, mitochondrial-like [Oncorhynchus gorbuscha]